MRMEKYLFSTFDVSRQGELQVGLQEFSIGCHIILI